jgi:hypothetical protein
MAINIQTSLGAWTAFERTERCWRIWTLFKDSIQKTTPPHHSFESTPGWRIPFMHVLCRMTDSVNALEQGLSTFSRPGSTFVVSTRGPHGYQLGQFVETPRQLVKNFSPSNLAYYCKTDPHISSQWFSPEKSVTAFAWVILQYQVNFCCTNSYFVKLNRCSRRYLLPNNYDIKKKADGTIHIGENSCCLESTRIWLLQPPHPPTYLKYINLQVNLSMFWIVMSCGLVGRHQHFEETYCLQPWGWKQYIYPKRWYLPTSLHGVTTQNNIDILTAVRTSNLI